jgi:nitrogen fixation/metabolism regulation signal transduction histidine kinase
MRSGRLSDGRIRVSSLRDGGILVMGRELQDQRELEYLIRRASVSGGIITLLMAVGGALAYGRQLEHRIGAIRQTAARIESGDFSQRIPTSGKEDDD